VATLPTGLAKENSSNALLQKVLPRPLGLLSGPAFVARLLAFETRHRFHPLGRFNMAQFALRHGVLLLKGGCAIVEGSCAPMGRLGTLMRRARTLPCRADTLRSGVAVVRDVATFLRVVKKNTRLAKGQIVESPFHLRLAYEELQRGTYALSESAGDWAMLNPPVCTARVSGRSCRLAP